MSVHPSLRVEKAASGSRRNVLKRHERVSHLVSTGKWVEGRSVFGLPKIKQEKIKARKAAAAGKEKEEAAPEASATKSQTAASPPK